MLSIIHLDTEQDLPELIVLMLASVKWPIALLILSWDCGISSIFYLIRLVHCSFLSTEASGHLNTDLHHLKQVLSSGAIVSNIKFPYQDGLCYFNSQQEKFSQFLLRPTLLRCGVMTYSKANRLFFFF